MDKKDKNKKISFPPEICGLRYIPQEQLEDFYSIETGFETDIDTLIWETHVQSVNEDAPKTKEQISMWISDAHALTDDWFFKMIDGELLRRFE